MAKPGYVRFSTTGQERAVQQAKLGVDAKNVWTVHGFRGETRPRDGLTDALEEWHSTSPRSDSPVRDGSGGQAP